MPEIIPAIIANSFQELQEKVKLVEPYVGTVQLDVMDGVFVPNKTWPYFAPQGGATNGKPFLCDLEKLETNLALEAHLMVDNPHRVLNEWLNSKVKRVILHWEAIKEIFHPTGDRPKGDNLIEQIHNSGKEFGIALNLETPISVLDNFIDYIDMVLLMSVKPGTSGQEFQESVIPKIISLRQKYLNVKIEVDGGINLINAEQAVEVGADYLAVGSAIWQSEDIGQTIKKLESII